MNDVGVPEIFHAENPEDVIEKARGLLKAIATLFALTGAVWVLFGAMNYYTHIGLTINTYEQQQAQQTQQTQVYTP